MENKEQISNPLNDDIRVMFYKEYKIAENIRRYSGSMDFTMSFAGPLSLVWVSSYSESSSVGSTDNAEHEFGHIDRSILFPMADHIAFAVKRMENKELIQ